MAESEFIKKVNDETFKDSVSHGVTLVDFFATWCGPCRMLIPVLEELAREMSDSVNFISVDVDESRGTAGECQITAMPTLILFKDGQEVDRVVGLKDGEDIKTMIQGAMA